MKHHLFILILAVAGLRGAVLTSSAAQNGGGIAPAQIKEAYDVVIAGAGTGGVGAAIQAARMGASVLLLDETDYIGGQMNAAAVTSMDEGGTLVRQRGLYRELVAKIEDYYGALGIDPETAYGYGHICVEPHVGRRLLQEMLDGARGKGTLDLSLRSRVIKVSKNGETVSGEEIEIVTEQGRTTRPVKSKILIDATEWGDVIPLTGARYRVGNCLSDAIVPTQKVQDNTWTAVVRQYPGPVSAGFLITEKPPGYDDAVHQRFVKSLIVGDDMGPNERPWSWARFIGYRGMPDSTRPHGARVITRTHLNFNNDFPSTVAEIEDHAQRVKTDREMRLRTLQLLYYVQNTLGFKNWGVADDEGYDTPYNRAEIDAWLKERPDLDPFRTALYHFPVIAYVRESRRIVGLHTLCAPEIDRRPGQAPKQFPTSVAIGDYPVDMHGSMQVRYLELDLDRAEDIPAKFGAHGKGPFSIPFECFIPEKLDGFLPAEKNISQSRMGNGATRLQPHTLLMGQASGAIAALAVRYGVHPRAVEPALVQLALAQAHDPLTYTPVQDVAGTRLDWPAIQMVTARGMLPLEGGRFEPRRGVTAAELSTIISTLGGTLPAEPFTEPVTRGAFAAALESLAQGARLHWQFSSNEKDLVAPITRSEAAQVLTDFLVLSAKAKMTGTPQVQVWRNVRPASEPSALDVTSTTVKDVQKLAQRKLIDSPEYWVQNAVPGGKCDGEKVAALFLRAAQAIDPSATSESAIDLMVNAKVFGAPDYWRKTAVAGATCDGKNVAVVLRNLAKLKIVSSKIKP